MLSIGPLLTRGILGLALVLAGCGGGSSPDELTPPPANTAPVATIVVPAAGLTFRAGDDIGYSGSATDAEDGALPGTSLTWWAELHHDTHTHPFLANTTGASGSVTIPVRGETADNIFYRFHLRATDSAGATHEVTRDLLPEKSRITLATVPAGLALTLDGQPVTSYPFSVLGVEGIERDLGAADQNLNGRRYRFTSWSDGGAASHTISTPVADTTYTATFTDIGPVNNQPPTVSLAAAATGTTGVPMQLTATAADADGSVTKVEFFEGATKLGEDLTSPYAFAWTPATTGARSLTARATDDQGATTTSSAVVVTVNAPPGPDTTAPTVTITAPAAFAAGLTGTVNFTAGATDNVGVVSVDFQLDGVALSTDTASPYAASFNAGQYALGQHVLRARARDAAGNVSPWVAITVNFSGGATQPAGFTRNENWVTTLSSATAFAQAPDGRLFIAQQGGALRVVKNGALLPTPFVSLTVDSSGERGLIGVTLDPAFATNGFVYIYHTVTAGGVHNRISRLTASGDVAAAGSETPLVDLPALSGATNHNGGAMHFGIDGKLYVAVGENASPSRAQDPNDVFGKMLRFNADGTIPSDNPFFATRSGQARAIWASGLRNPFTFAIQPGSGRIHINDVGQGTWEEVNLGTPGANYGWPASEGPDNVTGGVTGPLFAYNHSATAPPGSGPGGFFTGFAIAGGAFYPDSGPFPVGYRNQYYFADYVSRYVGRVDLASGNNNAAYAFATLSGNPVDMLVGIDGALYVLTRNSVVRISAP
jgi:glucose/arabinose dehydrogenase